MTALRVLSYGGGTQSAALALMVAAGELDPLDAVIFADTQGELPETYEYAEYVEQQLARAGVPFIRVTAGNLEAALLSDQPTSHNPTPPAHVLNPDGTKGKITRYRCSYDYKRRIITRQVKQLCGGRGAWKRANVEQWLGFSIDEAGRCKPADDCRCGHKLDKHDGRSKPCQKCRCQRYDPWQTNRWPLIELGFRREDTIRWFGEHGHPTPPRSACWFCPHSRNPRWVELKTKHPDLYERACQLDETIRNGGGFNARGNVPFAGQMFLHDSLTPLRDADLRSKFEREVDAGQGDLFDGTTLAYDCETGVCFT